MSLRRGRLAEYDFDSVVEEVRDWYHVPTLVLLMSFMFWVRARTWDRFTQDGRVLFSGNDAWYHYRQTAYTVRHWPETMPYDVWTYFPYGTAQGQFGQFCTV